MSNCTKLSEHFIPLKNTHLVYTVHDKVLANTHLAFNSICTCMLFSIKNARFSHSCDLTKNNRLRLLSFVACWMKHLLSYKKGLGLMYTSVKMWHMTKCQLTELCDTPLCIHSSVMVFVLTIATRGQAQLGLIYILREKANVPNCWIFWKQRKCYSMFYLVYSKEKDSYL